MNATQQLWMVATLVKSASIGEDLAAGASGAFGPLGAYLYARHKFPNNEHVRSDFVARNAIGSSLGGVAGMAAGIPVSMATGVPILPGMALRALLGAMGGGAASAMASRRHATQHAGYEEKKRKKLDYKARLKKLRERRDPDNIETS